ncbi:DUF2271 domain-containing protein [Aurantiacibacter flavus]|uniref:DUF2271 domain-containing protein n=1 Tax=Aurantiacibacter flavus TaxID=3145232 RepID=A0ABV0D1M9_9SPHN
MRLTSFAAAAVLASPALAAPALANSGTVTVEIPQASVRTYRKPFVAVWIENAAGDNVRTVQVLHDQARIARRWLPDLRSWWRQGGNAMSMPADGISSPTRAPGQHRFALTGLERLTPGNYSVVVEAARENGGRELVKVPFRLQRGRAANASASGSREVGQVSVAIRP